MKSSLKLISTVIMIATGCVSLAACTYQEGNWVLFQHNQSTQTPVNKKSVTVKKTTPIQQPTTLTKPPTEIVTPEAISRATKTQTSENPGPEFAAAVATQVNQIKSLPPETYQSMLPANELPLTWYFKPLNTLNIQLDTMPVDITIEPSTDRTITLKVLNDKQAKLVSGVYGNTLIIKMENYANPTRMVLALPADTHSLMLTAKGDIHGEQFPNTVHDLSILGANKVDLSSDNIMLNHLYIDRTQSVNINGIATPYLLVWVRQSGPVNLLGYMNLRELDTVDTGPVHAYWLNSPILTIRANKKNQIFLAGVADVFNFNLTDQSKLDARYLRVKKGFVKTQKIAEAKVTVLDSLNAFATGQSNIYYYHQPKLMGRYYKDQGSVLYMGDTPPPCDLAYCPTLPNPLPG